MGATAGVGGADRGTALLLVPAGILILVLLAAMAIDLSHLHVAQGRLSAAAQAAANDAATYGVAPEGLQVGGATGDLALDPARIEEAARRTLARDGALREGSIRLRSWQVTAPSATQVQVTLEAEIDHVFFQAVPGVRGPSRFTATAVADVRQD